MTVQNAQEVLANKHSLSGAGFLSADDAELVRKALDGNQDAFSHLFNRHRKRIFTICFDYSNQNDALAEDLCQETFIAAFNDLNKLRNESLFPYWVREIAKNKCLAHKQKQKTSDQALQDYAVFKRVMGEEKRSWSAQDLEFIAEFINGMKDSDLKETVRMFYLDGMQSSEIAKIQDISQTLVTTRLNRFRARFRKRITQQILKLGAPL